MITMAEMAKINRQTNARIRATQKREAELETAIRKVARLMRKLHIQVVTVGTDQQGEKFSVIEKAGGSIHHTLYEESK